MNKDRKPMYVSIFALVIAIVGVTVAYAALQTSLEIKFGSVTQSAYTWNIKLKNGNVAGNPTGSDKVICGNATVADSTVSVKSVNLSSAGDMCSYPLTVENNGEVDAILSAISTTSPKNVSCSNEEEGKLVCGNIVYRLSTDERGENLLTSSSQRVSKAGGTSNFYLVVSSTTDAAAGATVSQDGAGFTVIYEES